MAQRNRKGQEKPRGKIMEMVKRKHRTLKGASLELGISYSQAKRIYQRYLTGGDDALVHGNTGKPSNNKADENTVAQAVGLYREHYSDFGPTLAQETLLERDGLAISVSTLRRVLIATDYGNLKGRAGNIGAGGHPGRVLGSWCSLMGVTITGLRAAVPVAVLSP